VSDWVKKAATKLEKELGDKCPALSLADDAGAVSEWISTGVEAVDRYVIGGQGLPVGRVTELYSKPGMEKSTLAMTAALSAQRAGGAVIRVETEEALDQNRFRELGGDPQAVLVLRPETIEDLGQAVLASIQLVPAKERPTLVVWDSVAATACRAEVDGALEAGARMGEKARAIGLIMRVLLRPLREHRVALLAVNQVRATIGNMYGPSETTPGGNAIKFAASVRLKLLGGKAIKDGDGHIGKLIKVMAEKSRWAPPYRSCEARLLFASGWDGAWTTIALAKDQKHLPEAARVSADNLNQARAALG
jgi:recombination protein RecA